MEILAIGDVIGSPGRNALKRLLPGLRKEYNLNMVITNAENASGGIGVTPDTAQEMLDMNIDVLTSGNHIWSHREIIPYLDSEFPILRPLNYPPGVPGKGFIIRKGVMVINLIGRVFFQMDYDCPFRTMDKLLAEIKDVPPVIIIDFHAEATSEKIALGRYLDGRVTALLGTHTHVGTIDTQIFPKGTAYVTDIGMTGPVNSVIGDETGTVLYRFLNQIPQRLTVGKGKVILNGIVVSIDEKTGKATGIKRIQREIE
ncbi:MAG: TIGR00282 family metallophosphoesterase [Dehalococcoidales bacterium]|nr:TIGR00282 family metallophosphoesterase [Dehalococcoidales bacterium]